MYGTNVPVHFVMPSSLDSQLANWGNGSLSKYIELSRGLGHMAPYIFVMPSSPDTQLGKRVHIYIQVRKRALVFGTNVPVHFVTPSSPDPQLGKQIHIYI